MADKVEELARGRGAAAYREGTEQSFERAKTILSELLEATRSAAETILDDQKQRTAERVSGMAEAVRCAAQSLDRSENRAIARYADQGAGWIEDFSRLIRERQWSEIVADTEDLARRQPMLFVLGATAVGFLAGRLLSVPTDARQPEKSTPQPPDLSPHRGETDEITAAVSKLATRPTGAGKVAGSGAELDDRPESR
jgi:ElaB/YqjD/DUF883 family membrane-anchored ribosome-binding protein